MKDHRRDLLEGSLSWLVANLRFFDLPSKEEDGAEVSISIDTKRKAFGELCLTLFLMSRLQARSCPEFGLIHRHIKEAISDPYFSHDMMNRPNLLPFYLMVFLALRAAGENVCEQGQRLQRMVDFGLIDSIERTPWNQIDLRYYLDSADLEHRIADFGSLLRLSSARRPPPISHIRNIDVYALTHIIFHTTDFGRRSMEEVWPGQRTRELERFVTLLLGVFLRCRDWDLVSELLICCRCLGIEPKPMVALAWRGLGEAQRAAGDVPGLEFQEGLAAEGVDGRPAGLDRFRENYHPTMVTFFASLLYAEHNVE